jgi:hypothetical protein
MSATCQHDSWRELAVRENDGLAVSLLWSRSTGRVKVAVVDVHLDRHFEFHVPGADALAAFHHPFAYAAALGASFGDAVSCRAPRLTPERSAA